MNIGELKKIRKRYKYFWENGKFIVIDLQKQQAKKYRSVSDFISHYVYDARGLHSGFNYDNRLIMRRQYLNYIESIRKFKETQQ